MPASSTLPTLTRAPPPHQRTASRSAQIALALLAAETAAHLRLVLALDEADPIVLGGLAVDLADSAGSAAPFFVPGGDDAVLGHLLGIATVADAAAGEGSGPVLRSLHLQALSGMVLFRLGHSPLTCAKLAPPPSADQGEGHGHGRVRPERQLALLVATSGHAVHQVTEARAKLALALFHLHVAAHEGGAAGADAVLLCESLGYVKKTALLLLLLLLLMAVLQPPSCCCCCCCYYARLRCHCYRHCYCSCYCYCSCSCYCYSYHYYSYHYYY